MRPGHCLQPGPRLRLGREPILLEDAALDRIVEMADRSDEDSLRRALATLPEPQRAALLARVVDERSYAEIAARLACSESVVRQHVHRGLRRLRHELERER